MLKTPQQTEPLPKVWGQSFAEAVKEMLSGQLPVRPDHSNQIGLGLLALVLQDSDEPPTPFPALKLGSTPGDDLALAVGSILRSELFEGYFKLPQLRQIRSLPAMAVLMSIPDLLAKLTPAELAAAYDHLGLLAGAHEFTYRNLSANAALLAAGNSQASASTIGYARTRRLAEMSTAIPQEVRLRLPLKTEGRWGYLLGQIHPDLWLNPGTASVNVGFACSGSKPSCWAQIDSGDLLAPEQVSGYSALALIRAASTEKTCDTLQEEFESLQALGIETNPRLKAIAASRVLQRTDCSASVKRTALAWANQTRDLEGISPEDGLSLLHGLVTEPVILSDVHLIGPGYFDNVEQIFDVLKLTSGTLLTEELLLAAARRMVATERFTEIRYRLDGDVLNVEVDLPRSATRRLH
jgi:hypothetical protein